MDLQEFKTEFRAECSNVWEDAIGEFYECAGQLEDRRCIYPRAWITEQGLWPNNWLRAPLFSDEFRDTSDEDLLVIGSFLFRYLLLLKRKWLSPRRTPQF